MQVVEDLRGVAIVTIGGSVELEIAARLAVVEAGVLSTPQTRFQIASVSKQFAAAAVLLLAERGAVALDEPIDRWFPGCPTPWREMPPLSPRAVVVGAGLPAARTDQAASPTPA